MSKKFSKNSEFAMCKNLTSKDLKFLKDTLDEWDRRGRSDCHLAEVLAEYVGDLIKIAQQELSGDALDLATRDAKIIKHYSTALQDACDFAEEGWSYANDYFLDKHEFKRRLSALRLGKRDPYAKDQGSD